MVEQGAFHTVKTLISHGRKDAGQLSITMQIAYRWYHLYTGLRYHPFQHGQKSVKYVPTGWISVTQDFLAASEMSIHWQNMEQIPPRRMRDRNLMADANKHPYSASRLNHINNCRLYLRVEYLSDICDQAGKRILPEATEWHNPRTISQATKLFPKQACPGKKQWTMFRKFLRSTYGRNSWNFTLETPLGDWTTAHDEREWIHYHDHTYPAYFQRKQDKWLMWTIPSTHDPFTKIRIESSTPPFTIMESLPEDCIPISDITNKDGHIDYLIPTKNLRPVAVDIDELLEPQDIPANATFPDFIQSLQDAERILLEQNYEVNHDDGPSLLEMLQCPDQTAELIIVTDGGAVTNQGSFGWVIGTLDRVLWKCKGPAHGLPIHSFRAECAMVP
jgi:hypothetical protein